MWFGIERVMIEFRPRKRGFFPSSWTSSFFIIAAHMISSDARETTSFCDSVLTEPCYRPDRYFCLRKSGFWREIGYLDERVNLPELESAVEHFEPTRDQQFRGRRVQQLDNRVRLGPVRGRGKDEAGHFANNKTRKVRLNLDSGVICDFYTWFF